MTEFEQVEKINTRTGEKEKLFISDGKYYDSEGKEYHHDQESCDPDVKIIEEVSLEDSISNSVNSQPSIGMSLPNLKTENDESYEFFEKTGENSGAAVLSTNTRTSDTGEELTKEEAFLEFKTIPIEEASGPYATGYELEEGQVLRVTEELGNEVVFERKYLTFRWPSFRNTANGVEFYTGHLNLLEGYLKHPDLPTIGGSLGLGGIGIKLENGNLQFSNTKGTLSVEFQVFKQESKENHQKKVEDFQSLIDKTENRFERRITTPSGGGIKG